MFEFGIIWVIRKINNKTQGDQLCQLCLSKVLSGRSVNQETQKCISLSVSIPAIYSVTRERALYLKTCEAEEYTLYFLFHRCQTFSSQGAKGSFTEKGKWKPHWAAARREEGVGSVLREVRVRFTWSVERTVLGRGSVVMMTTATAITVPNQYVTGLTLFHPGRTLHVWVSVSSFVEWVWS